MEELGNWLRGWAKADDHVMSFCHEIWKRQRNLHFSMWFFKISTPLTIYIHFVCKKYRMTCLVASIGRDDNWNSEDYITTFWHGLGGVVKTGLRLFHLMRLSLKCRKCYDHPLHNRIQSVWGHRVYIWEHPEHHTRKLHRFSGIVTPLRGSRSETEFCDERIFPQNFWYLSKVFDLDRLPVSKPPFLS